MSGKNNQTIFEENRKQILLLLLIISFGLIIRIYKLGTHNIWFDELTSFAKSIKLLSYESFLYLTLLNFWIVCFGKSEFALRSLSLIFGVSSISLIYSLGKLFFDKKIGLASAFILAISPIHIWYSQEARGYTLSTFLVILTVYFFILAIRTRRIKFWLGFIIASILNLYTNFFSFFVIIILGSVLLLLKNFRALLKYYLLSLYSIFLICLPLIPLIVQRVIDIKNIFWIPKPKFLSLGITFENFNVGYNATVGIYFFTSVIFYALFILGVTYWERKKEELIFLISLMFIPIISTFLISQWLPIYLDRQLMLFSPFYYIIVSVGWMKIKSPVVKIIVILSISIAILFCLQNYFSFQMPMPYLHHIGVHPKKPVKPAMDYINSKFIEGDGIALCGVKPTSYTMIYYMSKEQKRSYFRLIDKHQLAKTEPYWYRMYIIWYRKHKATIMLKGLDSYNIVEIGEDEDSLLKYIRKYGYKRIWLVCSSWKRDGILEAYEKTVREWMQTHYLTLDKQEFDGICVDLYSTNN